MKVTIQIESHEFFKCKENTTIFRNQMYIDKTINAILKKKSEIYFRGKQKKNSNKKICQAGKKF